MEGSDHVDHVNRYWWRREVSIVWDPLHTVVEYRECVLHTLCTRPYFSPQSCAWQWFLTIMIQFQQRFLIWVTLGWNREKLQNGSGLVFTTYRQWHGKIMCLYDFPPYFELPVLFWASLKRIHNFCSLFYTLIGLDDGSSPFLLCSQ